MAGDTPSAYPLAWPPGWPRTPASDRQEARFGRGAAAGTFRALTLAEARERLQRELELLRATGPVLSTNVVLRLDGQPRSGQPEPVDPGAAVYFSLRGRPIALACDRWHRVPGNVAALAAHIGALRGMDRWGVGSVEQAFTGYAALPAPLVPDDWRAVLGNPRTLAEAEAAYRARARTAHPDSGGTHAAMSALTAAIAEARRVLRDA